MLVRVRMPEVLCALAIGVPLGCRDDDGTHEATSETSGHALPQCPAAADEPECIAAAGCAWEADVGCVVDCTQLDEQLACETLDYCYWRPEEGGCVWGIA